jgi:hypothetical protein
MYISAVITTCLYTVGASASIGEVSGKERERAHESKRSGLPPLSPWSLFIGELKMTVYILFCWWGKIL